MNKQHILSAGLELMYAKGYFAAGIQEIADASGVPKGSFYNHFASKEDFVVAAIEQYTQNMQEILRAALLEAEGPPLRRLRGMLEQWTAEFQSSGCRGCFAGNLSQELANHSTKAQRTLRSCFKTLEGYYVGCLKSAQESGQLSEELDSETLGQFIYNSWQGAIMRAKAQGSTRPLEACITTVFDHLLR